MEYSDDDEQSNCGCKNIFCCVYPTSRTHSESNQTQDQAPPELSAPTIAENKIKPIIEPMGNSHHHAISSRSGSDINKTFSDFISKSRLKIRAMSNVGVDDVEIVYTQKDEAHDCDKKADDNDVFSDYINRAKMKIRKASSIGSKRMMSFRK